MGNTGSDMNHTNHTNKPSLFDIECIFKKKSKNMVYAVFLIFSDQDGHLDFDLRCVHKGYESAQLCAKYNSQFIEKNDNNDYFKKSKLDEDFIYNGTRESYMTSVTYSFVHSGYLIEKIELCE